MRSLERRALTVPEYRKALILLLLDEADEVRSYEVRDLLDRPLHEAHTLLCALQLEGKIRVRRVEPSGSRVWERGTDAI
jgi:hypothetical protein